LKRVDLVESSVDNRAGAAQHEVLFRTPPPSLKNRRESSWTRPPILTESAPSPEANVKLLSVIAIWARPWPPRRIPSSLISCFAFKNTQLLIQLLDLGAEDLDVFVGVGAEGRNEVGGEYRDDDDGTRDDGEVSHERR